MFHRTTSRKFIAPRRQARKESPLLIFPNLAPFALLREAARCAAIPRALKDDVPASLDRRRSAATPKLRPEWDAKRELSSELSQQNHGSKQSQLAVIVTPTGIILCQTPIAAARFAAVPPKTNDNRTGRVG
jgi:hypothetical protein